MPMDWKLLNIDGELIQMVNCQYDSLDFSQFNNATKVEIDFIKKEARILEKEDDK